MARTGGQNEPIFRGGAEKFVLLRSSEKIVVSVESVV